MPGPSDYLPGAPLYDVEAHFAHVVSLHEQWPLNTIDKCNAHTMELLKAIFAEVVPWQIAFKMHDAIEAIYIKENLYFYAPPTIKAPYFLECMQMYMSDPGKIAATDAIVIDAFRMMMLHFPPSIIDKQSGGAQVPLHLLTDTLSEVVSDITTAFLTTKYQGDYLFRNLSHQLSENMARASGIDPRKPTTKRLLMPHENDVDPISYLASTPFKEFFETPVPFVIPRKTYAEHAIICSPSGGGKTQYLQSNILSLLNEPDPPAMFIIDSQDDENGILDKLAHLDVFHPDTGRLRDRLVVLSPEDKPALNLFQLGLSGNEADELFLYLASAIDRDLTAKMATAVAYIMRLIEQIPGATIFTFKDILENPKSYEPQIAKLDQNCQDFFRNQFSSKSELGATRMQVASRLYTVLGNKAFADMFAAPVNRFDVFAAMQARKIVLVNTSRRKLGSVGAKTFGRFIVAQCMAAAIRRGELKKHELALVILDEAHEYFDERTEDILRTARKFDVGMMVATQMYDTIDPKVKAAIATNTSIKLAGAVSHGDANQLANEMYTTSEVIRSCSTGEFATYVRGVTPHAIKLKVPLGQLEAAPRMSDEAYTRMREANRGAIGPLAALSAPPASHVPAATDDALKPGKEW